ncbi:S8 family serine peptidase [Haloarcula nitratireducens]|uniref:S8 family peptidase n=1 Tax=Haloarcula nitratireducens TaxID=2487749 RepID=A0AAW4PJ71_9EURY|nr:S8 family serine peptidase [Halomicroarcula nitratireducens]MBX0297688.1 S8 family peptidase [Halomicroarcula nitratireducens]
MLEPTAALADTLDIDQRLNYVADDAPDTTGHGEDVLELLGYFAPAATFSLYRVVAAHGTAKRGNLVQAIADASSHNIDILNLSVGIHHHEEPTGDCGGHCRIADEARLAIESGTAVVAAAGNREKDNPLAVHCPARLTTAITVGGFVSHCRADLLDSPASGQYWVDNDTELVGPFCGQRGCGPTKQCEEYRYEKPWQGNVSFHNAVPDVLAPVHHPAGTDTDPVLQSGTSFGTPIVSGSLATLLSDLPDSEPDPSPTQLRQAVSMGATDIDEGTVPKFDAGGTRELL